MHRRRTEGFLIGRTEVTFSDWLAYVEAQPEAERANLVPNLPAKLGGGVKLEHTPAGTPVRVAVSASGSEAVLEVADRGPGLGTEDAGRVFDRFFRVDEGRSRDDGGTGLGLSIVAAIAHAHGGKVELFTASGEGARFLVTLPLREGSGAVEGSAPEG